MVLYLNLSYNVSSYHLLKANLETSVLTPIIEQLLCQIASQKSSNLFYTSMCFRVIVLIHTSFSLVNNYQQLCVLTHLKRQLDYYNTTGSPVFFPALSITTTYLTAWTIGSYLINFLIYLHVIVILWQSDYLPFGMITNRCILDGKIYVLSCFQLKRVLNMGEFYLHSLFVSIFVI